MDEKYFKWHLILKILSFATENPSYSYSSLAQKTFRPQKHDALDVYIFNKKRANLVEEISSKSERSKVDRRCIFAKS